MANSNITKATFLNRPEKAAYLFLAPTLIIMTIFVFIPLAVALFLGLTDINLFLQDFNFVGLDNFKRALADPRVSNSFKNTIYFTLLSTPIQIIFSLIVASMVSGSSLFEKFMRSVYFIPVVCSMTAAGLMSALILDPNIGIIPYAIFKMGFSKPLMLKDPNMAMPLIALITVWKNFGRTMIILVAGIGGISKTYYEASEIDGASKVQQFLKITIPMLIPSLSFCIITTLINSFQVFDQVYVATGGGPMFRTETVVQYIYTRAFSSDTNLGYASSIALLLFLLIVILTLTLNKFLQSREETI